MYSFSIYLSAGCKTESAIKVPLCQAAPFQVCPASPKAVSDAKHDQIVRFAYQHINIIF